ncbi:zinc ribbon domain-containing protein [Desulfurispora thermophila]
MLAWTPGWSFAASCTICGLVLHRDVNAARNILLLALSG